jgi:nicotinamidase-related amidase
MALLIVDPYNDFISEGGKLWPRLKETAEAVDCVKHMRQVVAAARAAGIRIFIAPHRRWREGDYADWQSLAPVQRGAAASKVFAEGTWGGDFHPDFQPAPGDIVASQHWASSGFANTDLDLLLKKHGISKVVVIGLRANTCIESTVRHAVELGYDVTLVRDAIASFGWDEMKAALEVNLPLYASALVSTEELVAGFRERVGLESRLATVREREHEVSTGSAVGAELEH